MRRHWYYTKKKTLHSENLEGVYAASTTHKRIIKCYGINSTDAYRNLATSLKPDEFILSIFRD